MHPLFQPVTWLKGSLLIEIVFLYCGVLLARTVEREFGISDISYLALIAFLTTAGGALDARRLVQP